MVTVGQIYDFIDAFAPFSTAMDFDNPGLLVGARQQEVTGVLLALDITASVVKEAQALGDTLILSHHPVIFHPLRALQTDTAPYLLAKAGISAICAHTNLDLAPGGVNTCLAERIGLQNVAPLALFGPSSLAEGLLGELKEPMEPAAFAKYIKQALGCDGLRYTDGGRPVQRVGLCSGGGAHLLYDAVKAGAQAFVTGESKHNQLLDAVDLKCTLVDAGHFYTEDVVILPLMERLSREFPSLTFQKSKTMQCPVQFV